MKIEGDLPIELSAMEGEETFVERREHEIVEVKEDGGEKSLGESFESDRKGLIGFRKVL